MLQIHYYIWLLERLIMMIHCSVSRAVQFAAVLQKKKIQRKNKSFKAAQETEAVLLLLLLLLPLYISCYFSSLSQETYFLSFNKPAWERVRFFVVKKKHMWWWSCVAIHACHAIRGKNAIYFFSGASEIYFIIYFFFCWQGEKNSLTFFFTKRVCWAVVEVESK